MVITDEAHADVARRAAGDDGVVSWWPGTSSHARSSPESTTGTAARRSRTSTPTTTAWIFYTSGTTGRPKGAMLSHAVLNFVTVSWLADLTPLDEHDVTLHAAPLSHGAGFHALAAVARARPPGDPRLAELRPGGDACDSSEPRRDQHVDGADPDRDAHRSGRAPGLTGADLPSLQYVVYGGAPMTPAAMTRALDRFGPVFVQLYGQGETPMTATVLRREDHVPGLLGSAGRRPAGHRGARSSTATVATVAPGEVGEVVVRGPSVMTGYWNRPDATAETIVDGWLHTGDLGRMTGDGVLHLLDRTKDMIISGGSNVYAVEVEAGAGDPRGGRRRRGRSACPTISGASSSWR